MFSWNFAMLSLNLAFISRSSTSSLKRKSRIRIAICILDHQALSLSMHKANLKSGVDPWGGAVEATALSPSGIFF